MEIELECIVHGKVHGVGYRQFIKDKADEAGFVGYAENLPDGNVEVVAQGEKEALEKFLEHVKRGPFFAKVDDVEIQWHDTLQDALTEFEIR